MFTILVQLTHSVFSSELETRYRVTVKAPSE